jgi:hypothetical protein
VQYEIYADKKYLEKSLSENLSQYQQMVNSSNYFSLSYDLNQEKLNLTLLLFKEKTLESFNSFYINSISINESINATTIPAKLILDEADGIGFEAEDFSTQETEERRNNFIAKKLAQFIIRQANSKESEFVLTGLTTDKISKYLSSYPIKKTLSYLSSPVLYSILAEIEEYLHQQTAVVETKKDELKKIKAMEKKEQIDQLREELERKLGKK